MSDDLSSIGVTVTKRGQRKVVIVGIYREKQGENHLWLDIVCWIYMQENKT